MSTSSPQPDDAALLDAAAELRTLVAKLRRTLNEQASPGEFTSSQVSVVRRLLQDGPASLTALAKAEGMRPQSMSAIVAVLAANGVVEGRPHPTDGRQTILAVTEDARERIETARTVKNDWLFRSIRAKYSPAEQLRLVDSIALLQRLLEP